MRMTVNTNVAATSALTKQIVAANTSVMTKPSVMVNTNVAANTSAATEGSLRLV